MANKAFEIQESKLRIGGVDLEAGTTGVVIPGITQAATYFVEEVDDRGGNNPDIFGSDASAVRVIDNAQYLVLSGTTPSASYVAAGYSVDELDDGEIDGINVEVDGVFAAVDKNNAEAGNMWAIVSADPYTTFVAGDWTQIPFRPKIRAGEVENIGGGGGGASNLSELGDVALEEPSDGQVLMWNNSQEKWQNQSLSGGGSSDKLVSGDLELVFNDSGTLTFPGPGGGSDVSVDQDTGTFEISTPGNIVLHNTSGSWTFSGGDLKLPAGGDIVNSSGTSVLGGGGSGGISFTEAGGLEFPDGSTQTTAYVTPVQLGYFNELNHAGDNNRVNGEAVAMDSGGNSYVSYSYYDDNDSRDYGGVMKFSSAGAKLWSTNIVSQNNNADYVQIVSLEYSTVNSSPVLIAFGRYYDNNTGKDVGIMYYVDPSDGSVGSSLVDAEITTTTGIRLNDGVVGVIGEGDIYAVVVGESYDEVLQKSFTPLAPSTTDKLYVSWTEFNASGVLSGAQIIYNTGGYYGVKMNSSDVTASPDGTGDGIGLAVSAIEGGTYTINRLNGYSGVIYGWSIPVTLRVLGSNLGGADGVNDFTFDFNLDTFNANNGDIQLATSNKAGTPISDVYCSGWNGKDWGAEIGNILTFNYELGNQAYIARLGATSWSKTLGATNYDKLYSVVVDDSNNVYAVGNINNGTRGAYVVKYNAAGAQQWSMYVDSSNNMGNSLTSIDLLADGNLITIDEDGVVTKIDSSNGDIMWQQTVDNGPSWDGDFKGTATPDGDYILTNYEDNDYTIYVIRVSGADGNVMWSKQISRSFGGQNGEITPENDFGAQYIDCNDTYVTIGATSNNNNGSYAGLVISFPIDGTGIDGIYGQYIISSQSLDWTTNSTTSVDASSITESTSSASVTPVSPTGSESTVTVSKTNIGAADTAAPVAGISRHSASSGDNNITLAEEHNGKFLYYNGSNGNSWIYVPSENDTSLPIGYTVTVVMDDFGGNRIYVNNDTGNQNATINASGFNYNETNYWQFGATNSKCGVYTIMKVDTDRWMLAGPDVTPD